MTSEPIEVALAVAEALERSGVEYLLGNEVSDRELPVREGTDVALASLLD